jgi:hypothetical protein
MTEQTKLVLIGASVAAGARYGFHRDWKTALLFGAGAIVALVLYDAATHPV